MSPQGSSNPELSGLGAKWGWFWGQASPGDNVKVPQYPNKRSRCSDGNQG